MQIKELLYISAQPDEQYFIWQLKLLIRNLQSLLVSKENIHILVSYKKDHGLNEAFADFIKEDQDKCLFFIYEDTRKVFRYLSTIRPHILKKHYKRYPLLNKKTIFYHDSDILFSRLPNIKDLRKTDVCYVSNTRNYIGLKYLRSFNSEELLLKMTSALNITIDILELNDENAGGAQYILNNIDSDFWKKVERDSENLFNIMEEFNESVFLISKGSKREIQSWCADMWALLWNLWLENKKVLIHEELEFSWPNSPIADWKKKSILHYSGKQKDGNLIFCKLKYKNFPPWNDLSLGAISKEFCGYAVVEKINSYRKEIENTKISIPNTLLIYNLENLEINDKNVREQLTLTNMYLSSIIEVKSVIWNKGNIQEMSSEKFEFPSKHHFTKMMIVPFNFILNRNDLLKVFKLNNAIICPKKIVKFDLILAKYLKKTLDIGFITENMGKCSIEICVGDNTKIICYPLLKSEIRGDLIKKIESKSENFKKVFIDYCYVKY
ncbi:hypothetical protein [Sphingobacterium kitahiroshimense]|uniref:Uncharacterized protein n=1 Tax=Sphingobacterium kitahiroshimense TaxID=470446 RepID=A0ABV0BQA8_9SPHI